MHARISRSAAVAASIALFGWLQVACSGTSDDHVLDPVVLALADTVAPVYDDGETQIYQVTTPVDLPLRRPGEGERPAGAVDPYPRAPFFRASDTRSTVRFTLTNMTDAKQVVELLLDPWNEFVRYSPGIQTTNDGATPNLSGWDRFFVLDAKARIEGIITPDDVVELARDLATAMALEKRPPAPDGAFAGPALYNRAFNAQNRSTEPDPLLAPYIPATIAGVTGFDLGLRMGAPATVAVELVLDVLDVTGDRVIADADRGSTKPVGMPGNVLTPPAVPAQ